jgi:hypothetical protein
MIFFWTKFGMDAIDTNGLFAEISLCTLRAFQNNVGFDWLRVSADMVEAAYTGYAAVDLSVHAPLGPYQDPILQNIFYKTPMQTLGKCTALPETLYGVYLAETIGGPLVGMAVFDTPVVLVAQSTPMVNVLYSIGQGQQLSGNELDLS